MANWKKVLTSGGVGAADITGADGSANQYLKTDGSGTLAWISPSSGDITGVTLAGDSGTAADGTGNVNLTLAGGTGIDTSASATTVTFALDFSELTDMTGDVAAGTEMILQNGSVESRKALSEIKLSYFNNDAGWDVGDVSQMTVTADDGGASQTGPTVAVGVLGGTAIDTSRSGSQITVNFDGSELTTQNMGTASQTLPFLGNVSIAGNLTVAGTTITTATETLNIADNTMVLNSDLTGASVDAGFVVQLGSGSASNPSLWFDVAASATDTTGRWVTGLVDDATAAIGGYRADVMQVRIDGAAINSSSQEVPVGHLQYHNGELHVRLED